MTNKLAAAAPEALNALQTEADRLLCVLPRVRAAMTAEATEALLVVGLALMAAYRRLKESRALLDYGDLIDKAAGLLQGEGSASWVLYKLDGGIDHVLIDEAQDTSPEQWQVIKDLTREFFAGQWCAGHRPHHLRRRRRQAVDLQLPGCRSGRLPRHPRCLRPVGAGDAVAADRAEDVVPLDPRRAGGGRRDLCR